MSGRLMIRLIDVALNLLLCFIAISHMKTEYVELPTAEIVENQVQLPHEAVVHVYSNLFKFKDGGRDWSCQTLQDLENILVSQSNRYAKQKVKLIVTIEPHRSSIMQNLVDVMDVCQRNNIEKNLDYESYN